MRVEFRREIRQLFPSSVEQFNLSLFFIFSVVGSDFSWLLTRALTRVNYAPRRGNGPSRFNASKDKSNFEFAQLDTRDEFDRAQCAYIFSVVYVSFENKIKRLERARQRFFNTLSSGVMPLGFSRYDRSDELRSRREQ